MRQLKSGAKLPTMQRIAEENVFTFKEERTPRAYRDAWGQMAAFPSRSGVRSEWRVGDL